MSDCIRRCTIHNQHNAGCTCTAECPDHGGHCKGCLPEEAATGELCRRCINQITAALRSIPELTAHAASRTDGKLSPVRKGNTDGMPKAAHVHAASLSPAWDTAEEVWQWSLRTALACADDNGHTGPFRYRLDGLPARNITELINYIGRNLAWYATVIPEDIHAEATGLHRNLERVTGQGRVRPQRLKEACPSCHHLTLVRDETLRVTCRNDDCARVWKADEYDATG